MILTLGSVLCKYQPAGAAPSVDDDRASLFFQFQLTVYFVLSVLLISLAIYLYSVEPAEAKPKTYTELLTREPAPTRVI